MRRTLELKRVDIGSLFKVAFVLYVVLGLVAGLFFGMAMMMFGQLTSLLGEEHIPGLRMISGVAGFVMVPIMAMCYGIVGSIVVSIVGLLYNFAAGRFGGLKLEFDTGEVAPAATPAPATSQT
jgi:Transmembrane domain of unknown function (DUF3566)